MPHRRRTVSPDEAETRHRPDGSAAPESDRHLRCAAHYRGRGRGRSSRYTGNRRFRDVFPRSLENSEDTADPPLQLLDNQPQPGGLILRFGGGGGQRP